MTLAVNNIVTWADFASICLNSIKSVCCNIDSYSSDVPARLKSSAATTTVKSITTSKSGGNSGWKNAPITYSWNVRPYNTISIVYTSTVNSEWNTFLNAANINSRSNKVISPHDFTLAVGLYMQFMSFHIKPIYSRRQAYNTVESQSVWQGCKYVSGTCNPSYTLGANAIITQTGQTSTNNAQIQSDINNNIDAYRLFRRYDNPSITRHILE